MSKPQSKKYRVTCKECQAERVVGIVSGYVQPIIDWLDNNPDPTVTMIVSGRNRLDGNWGWECICGNNDLLTEQEKKEIKNLQNPDPKDLSQVIKNLIPQRPKFEMRAV